MACQDTQVLGVEMEGETRGFRDVRVQWEGHEVAKMGLGVSARDDWLDLEMA